MYSVSFQVTGITDLMFGKHVTEPKRANETHQKHEERTWEQKVRTTPDGQCVLNSFAVTNSLVEAGAWLKKPVPGEGKATYTKRFKCGVSPGGNVLICTSGDTPATIKDIDPVGIFAPSDGKHGGDRRVDRIFPTLHQWVARGECHVFDDKIDHDTFREHFACVGQFVGWGSMRVANGGINGRFKVDSLEYGEYAT